MMQDEQTLGSLNALGIGALAAILVCHAFQFRSPRWLLGLAFSCGAGAVYCYLQDAWPFWLFELVCCIAVLLRWMQSRS